MLQSFLRPRLHFLFFVVVKTTATNISELDVCRSQGLDSWVALSVRLLRDSHGLNFFDLMVIINLMLKLDASVLFASSPLRPFFFVVVKTTAPNISSLSRADSWVTLSVWLLHDSHGLNFFRSYGHH